MFARKFLFFFLFKLDFQVNLKRGVVNCVLYASFGVLTLVLTEIRIYWGKMLLMCQSTQRYIPQNLQPSVFYLMMTSRLNDVTCMHNYAQFSIYWTVQLYCEVLTSGRLEQSEYYITCVLHNRHFLRVTQLVKCKRISFSWRMKDISC